MITHSSMKPGIAVRKVEPDTDIMNDPCEKRFGKVFGMGPSLGTSPSSPRAKAGFAALLLNHGCSERHPRP